MGYQLTTHVHQKWDVYSTCQTSPTSGLIDRYQGGFNLRLGISSFAGRPMARQIFYLLNGHHRRSSSSSGSWGLRLNCPSPRTSLQAGVHLRWCPTHHTRGYKFEGDLRRPLPLLPLMLAPSMTWRCCAVTRAFSLEVVFYWGRHPRR